MQVNIPYMDPMGHALSNQASTRCSCRNFSSFGASADPACASTSCVASPLSALRMQDHSGAEAKGNSPTSIGFLLGAFHIEKWLVGVSTPT